MTKPSLAVANLQIHHGRNPAVRDVSFQVEAGSVFGLIGPEGAGKTSLLASITNLIEPTRGTIHVCGLPVTERPDRAVDHVGYVPTALEFQPGQTVREFLELFASAHGIPRSRRGARIDEIQEQMGLTGVSAHPANELDRRLQLRLSLGRALLHDPEVLLLDEPATGLDERARRELFQTLDTLGQIGKALVVTSPVLDEVESCCTHLGILDGGVLISKGRTIEVLEGLRPGRSIRLSLVQPDGRLARFLSEQPNVKDVEADHETARFHLEGGLQEAAGLLRRLVESDFELAHFAAKEGGLDDILAQVHGDGAG